LLHGASSRLFEHQILDEILPKDSASAETARQILTAGFDAFAKVSHPAKRFSVLAYLLAQPSDTASVGAVLRSICEAYGLPLVKLGQGAAASGDLLPPDVREEMAKLRDQANEPYWHEIYERISEVSGIENLEPVLRVRKLLGAASVKYAALVEDMRTGELHAVQVKRAEADASISKDFRELDIMVNTLIKQDPVKFAFLRGLLEATRAAIWRELSLLKESERTRIMSEEYARAESRGAPRTEVPETTDLIDKMGGSKNRFFFLRSSRFVEGKSLGELTADDRLQESRAVLAAEHELMFPSDQGRTHFDPDRHPGNEKFHGHRQAIDFGQTLELAPEDVTRITRLMALSQILEVTGPTDAALRTLVKEFLPSDGDPKRLIKNLRKYYPNRTPEARSALAGYYFVLGELEGAGMDRRILNYDFIKAIFQLEPYEEVLGKREHISPKATFALRVEAEARRLGPALAPSKLEILRGALLRPRDTVAVLRNLAKLRSDPASAFNNPFRGERSDSATQTREVASPGRKRAPQPKFPSHLSEVGKIYAAELASAVFWGFYDRDPTRATEWLKSLATIEKHVGFGVFAVGAGLTTGAINRTLPTSWSKTRWMGQHGLSMAVGMVASDIVSRLVAGQPLDEIIDHELSLENFKEVSLATSSFLAAQLALDGIDAALGHVPAYNRLHCRMPFLAKGKTALMFTLAEGIQRGERSGLERAGVIEPREADQLREIAREGSAAYGARLAEIDVLYKDSNSRVKAMLKMGCGANLETVRTPQGEFRQTSATGARKGRGRDAVSDMATAEDYLEDIKWESGSLCNRCRTPDTPAEAICDTIDHLRSLQLKAEDSRTIEMIGYEIAALYQGHAVQLERFVDQTTVTSDQIDAAGGHCSRDRFTCYLPEAR
ncbi:MAG: hypothetical protein AAB425_05310, partial [Bdellovibrionota bacterium]